MKHRTNMYFTDAQIEGLRALSQKTGAPLAELVRRAVDAYLKKEGRAPAHSEREREKNERTKEHS